MLLVSKTAGQDDSQTNTIWACWLLQVLSELTELSSLWRFLERLLQNVPKDQSLCDFSSVGGLSGALDLHLHYLYSLLGDSWKNIHPLGDGDIPSLPYEVRWTPETVQLGFSAPTCLLACTSEQICTTEDPLDLRGRALMPRSKEMLNPSLPSYSVSQPADSSQQQQLQGRDFA